MLLGRPWPQPGEPLFTEDDTAYALALAEEERDTCPNCGMPVAVCSDPQYQFAFEPSERVCWPTARMALHRASPEWEKRADEVRQATMLAARFREGHAAPLDAGLDLTEGN